MAFNDVSIRFSALALSLFCSYQRLVPHASLKCSGSSGQTAKGFDETQKQLSTSNNSQRIRPLSSIPKTSYGGDDVQILLTSFHVQSLLLQLAFKVVNLINCLISVYHRQETTHQEVHWVRRCFGTMGIGNIWKKIRADANVSRAVGGIVRGAEGLPAGTGRDLIAKVPAARWLPNYSPIWLIDDVIAGLSVGALLVPQALVYSVLAGMPLQDALLASWLPSLIYTVMGIYGHGNLEGYVQQPIVKKTSS
jgi:hypothetical protein